MARIEISNDPSGRIIVSFPYDPLLVEKVKSIDGRRWHPVEKHWSFPKLDGLLEKILKVFGNEDIQIDSTLKGTVPDLRTEQRAVRNKLTKMPLRSNAWTAFAFWLTVGG